MVLYFSILKTFGAILPWKMVKVQWTFSNFLVLGKIVPPPLQIYNCNFRFSVPLLHWKIHNPIARQNLQKGCLLPSRKSFLAQINRRNMFTISSIKMDGHHHSPLAPQKMGREEATFGNPNKKHVLYSVLPTQPKYLFGFRKNVVWKKEMKKWPKNFWKLPKNGNFLKMHFYSWQHW